MKKNRIMRVFSVLLALTLISTCAISGTFAKYVTKAEGEDAARVAKWGILVSVNGNKAFDTQYKTDDEDAKTEIEYSVVSSNKDKVVAPGTTNPEPVLSGNVKGTPEVATRYTLVIKDWTDIVLPQGTYTDYTNYVLGEGYTGTFTTPADYTPIKWDITVSNGTTTKGLLTEAAKKLGVTVGELNENGLYGFSATEAKEIMTNYASALEGLLNDMAPEGAHNAKVKVDGDTITLSMDFDPNIPMDYTFALTWMWNFEGQMVSMTSPSNVNVFTPEMVDQADTYLGNVIAGVVDDQNAKTTITATVVATATQID